MNTIELVLSTATRVAIYVDQENGAPDFWVAVETQAPPDTTGPTVGSALSTACDAFVSPSGVGSYEKRTT